jgi:hypothetical protein
MQRAPGPRSTSNVPFSCRVSIVTRHSPDERASGLQVKPGVMSRPKEHIRQTLHSQRERHLCPPSSPCCAALAIAPW